MECVRAPTDPLRARASEPALRGERTSPSPLHVKEPRAGSEGRGAVRDSDVDVDVSQLS